MCRSARARAKKKNLEFLITSEDIEIPDTCPLLGIPLTTGIGGIGLNEGSPTLDRIDSSKGYIKGNILVISHKANRIKNDASLEELLKITKALEKLMNDH